MSQTKDQKRLGALKRIINRYGYKPLEKWSFDSRFAVKTIYNKSDNSTTKIAMSNFVESELGIDACKYFFGD